MDFAKHIRPEDIAQLEANWTEQQPLKGTGKEKDYQPVVKLFNPCGAGTWLLTEKEPGTSLAFGLGDLGGCAELGYVCLEELLSIKLMADLTIEQDLYWSADYTLSEYATAARMTGYIRT